MSTLKQIVDNIAGNIGKMDDLVFKKRIQNSVIAARSEALRRDYNKRGVFPASMIQRVGCLEMIEVDPKECCDESPEKCTILRTKEQIPSPIRVNDDVSFTFVGSTNGGLSFGYLDTAVLRFLVSTDKQPRYTYLNRYIYTFFSSMQEISIQGVFNNPFDFQVKDCKGILCTPNLEITEDLEYVVKQLVYEELRLYIPRESDVRLNPSTEQVNQ